jgi:hypothetical protein
VHFRFCVGTILPVLVSLTNVILRAVVDRPLKLKGDVRTHNKIIASREAEFFNYTCSVRNLIR